MNKQQSDSARIRQSQFRHGEARSKLESDPISPVYLAEFLLNKGYEVHGIKRRSSLFNTARIDHLFHDVHEKGQPFFLHHGDMTDSSSLTHIIQKVQPDEIYNLAAQSHVAVSFEEPEYTANSDALGPLRILEAIRILGLQKKTRFYQASTSELYGLVQSG